MKLAYLQSCENPLDPLPKLGKKVEPANFSPEAMAQKLRRMELTRFSCGDHSINAIDKPQVIGIDLATKTDTTVVSFADAAEMADAPTRKDLFNAYERATIRLGTSAEAASKKHRALIAVSAAKTPWLHTLDPSEYPAAIAALEALR